VGCWHGYLSGARCRLAYGPADTTATRSLSLASVKSRLVVPFWYRLTQVVLDKGPLNGCVHMCSSKVVRPFWTDSSASDAISSCLFCIPSVQFLLPAVLYSIWQLVFLSWLHTQFRQHLKTHLFRASKLQHIVTLDYCVLYKYSYLLPYKPFPL